MSTRKKQARPDTSSARLAALLKKSGTMELAIEELHGSLKAMKTYFDTPSASWMTAPDYASRIKAVEIALNFSVGSPVKRQQILSGKMPDAPLDREQLRDAILRRIALKLEQPDLSASELLSLRKAFAEQLADSPPEKLSQAERTEEVERILGIEWDHPGRSRAGREEEVR